VSDVDFVLAIARGKEHLISYPSYATLMREFPQFTSKRSIWLRFQRLLEWGVLEEADQGYAPTRYLHSLLPADFYELTKRQQLSELRRALAVIEEKQKAGKTLAEAAGE
jgi:hypothetical protein